MLSRVASSCLSGLDGNPVVVEVHVSQGIPGFTVVGLPDAACRESRDRVRSALISSGFAWPQKRVTVNLAPSGTRKCGAGLDLPIAIGLLVAVGDLPRDCVDGKGFIGELGLDGSVRSVPGMISLVDAIRARVVVLSRAAIPEALIPGGKEIRVVDSLAPLAEMLKGHVPWGPPPPRLRAVNGSEGGGETAGRGAVGFDMADVKGQRLGRRAIEIAAAGGHHLLLVGPPGSGKTMLARRLPGLLPLLTRDEAVHVARIRSAAGLAFRGEALDRTPPFRAPHHGASAAALIGGGSSWLRPGEISFADRGVLFLDELGEFSTGVVDSLREPLEEGVVRISRARQSVVFPAQFLLVAAMNPCPCGEGTVPGACRCGTLSIARYTRRLSGPLVDRFDIRVGLTRPGARELMCGTPGESSAEIAGRVESVRQLARRRGGYLNGAIPDGRLDRFAPLTARGQELLTRKLSTGSLSARGMVRIRRVARTIADLEGSRQVEEHHVAEAIEMRAGIGSLIPEVAA